MPLIRTMKLARLVRWGGLAALLGGLAVADANALTVTLAPATQSVVQDQTAQLDIVVGDVLPAGLGGYSITLAFDPSILDFASAVSHLPGVTWGLSAKVSAPGQLELSDLSFEEPADLVNLESASFTLATVSYKAIGVGTSAISVTKLDLADAAGSLLAAGLPAGAAVTVSAVPEPATLLSLLGGLAVVGAAVRRRSAE